jgi:hypothetical protein
VVAVSDAVKVVGGDMLTEDVDRTQVWGVRGIAIDHSVAVSLPEGTFTMAEVIQLVEQAGHVWSTTPL